MADNSWQRRRALTLVCSQDESSEQFIGEWMSARGIRDQLVIATKVGQHRCVEGTH